MHFGTMSCRSFECMARTTNHKKTGAFRVAGRRPMQVSKVVPFQEIRLTGGRLPVPEIFLVAVTELVQNVPSIPGNIKALLEDGAFDRDTDHRVAEGCHLFDAPSIGGSQNVDRSLWATFTAELERDCVRVGVDKELRWGGHCCC
jgi:hypothetical protein